MRFLYVAASAVMTLVAALLLWATAVRLRHHPLSWRLSLALALAVICMSGAWRGFSHLKRAGPELTHRARRAFLGSPLALAVALLFCLVESGWSWASLTNRAQPREGPVTVLFLAFGIFVAASIAYRTVLWAHRMVFGAAAAALALGALRAAALPPAATVSVDVAHALMWTIAAGASLAALASGALGGRRVP